MAYLDEDGNEVVGVLPPEEIKALQDKAAALEEKAKLAEDLTAKLTEKEAELSKLASKDLNFSKLRDKSEAEIEALKSKMNEKDKLVLNEVMDLRREKADMERKVEEKTRADVMKSLTGGDEAVQKSIELALREIGGLGDAKTPEEIEAKYRTAFIVAKGQAPSRNPLFSGYSSSYREPNLEKKDFTETEQGKESFRKWFPNIADKIIKS